MDIYSLINSKAISEHCRKIAHQFTPLEMAYLVNENESLTIKQKHQFFREIIAKQPDMEVAERPRTPHFDSLHNFLQTYMELQNKYLNIFYQDELHCVYCFEIKYTKDVDFCADFRLYADWDSCYKAIAMETEKFCTKHSKKVAPFEIRVTKRWINHANEQSDKFLTVNMLSGNNPINIGEGSGVIDEKDDAVLRAFTSLWIEIPTPFQKGDILVERNNDKPFVLDRIPYWLEHEEREKQVQHSSKYVNKADLTTSIYKLSNDGTILRDSGPKYLDLEYCKRKLEGVEEFLWIVSGAVTGKLSVDILLHSYDMIKSEQHVREEIEYLSDKVNEISSEAVLDMKGASKSQSCEKDHAVIKDYWSPLVSTSPLVLFPQKFFDRIMECNQIRRSKK